MYIYIYIYILLKCQCTLGTTQNCALPSSFSSVCVYVKRMGCFRTKYYQGRAVSVPSERQAVVAVDRDLHCETVGDKNTDVILTQEGPCVSQATAFGRLKVMRCHVCSSVPRCCWGRSPLPSSGCSPVQKSSCASCWAKRILSRAAGTFPRRSTPGALQAKACLEERLH